MQENSKITSSFRGTINSGELLLRMTSGKIEAVKAGDVEIPDL
jgi:hypothetical protein